MDEQEQSSGQQSWLTVPLAVIIGAVIISGSVLYSGSSGSSASILKNAQQQDAAATETPIVVQDPEKLIGSNSPSMGNANAPVTIVEFSDFQCPFCRVFWNDTHGKIKKDYVDTGKVRLVFRHFPLSFHAAARPAALASACAFEQGKFWQYHDKLFGEQEKQGQGTITFGTTELKLWAQQIGLNTTKFNTCLDSEKYAEKIDADIQAGTDNGVTGTPSFFINGKLLVGAQPYEQFQQMIDAELR